MGIAGNTACTRCEGAGIVCAYCKGIGFVYRQRSDGRALASECGCGKVAARRLKALWPFLERYSSLQGELRDKSFENFTKRAGLPDVRVALEAAQKFARKPEGWLFFNGRPGVGKTHLSAAIANTLLARHQPVLFLNVPELLVFLREGFQSNLKHALDPDFETRLRTIKEFPILILDDWGAHSDTPWADEQLYLILNNRTERILPTVVTSNLKTENIELRVRSRLMNRHIGQVIEILAPDYRIAD